jgi:hypothetical protein
MMSAKKWPKWAAGITSVLSFTGFLYMTQKDHLDITTSAQEPKWRGWDNRDAAVGEYYRGDSTKGEIFLYEAESIEAIQKWPQERKSERERLLESLSWDEDPDSEITMPGPADQSWQGLPRSNAKTRRS